MKKNDFVGSCRFLLLFGCLVVGVSIQAQTRDSLTQQSGLKDSVELGEVVVTAQKTQVRTKADRLIFNVQSDEDVRVKTVLQMLEKVPFVNVDAQKNITVKGSGKFRIYKNGRPSNTYTNNYKEVLASIPATAIKDIEVITEPGAKYDAEGVDAIINIITNENTVINGLMGQVSLAANTNGRTDGNIYLATQLGKLDLSLVYGAIYLSKENTQHFSDVEYKYSDSGATQKTNSEGTNKGLVHFVNIDGSYQFNAKNLLALSFGGYWYNVEPVGTGFVGMYDKLMTPIFYYRNVYDYCRYNFFDFNGGLDYQHTTDTKGEILTLSYKLSTSATHQKDTIHYEDMYQVPVDYTGYYEKSNGDFYEHTLQADYERPLSEHHTIDFGGKYILRDNSSNTLYDYFGSHKQETDFTHYTHVGALYGEYRLFWNAFSAIAGLRYEYSYLKARFRDGSTPDYSRNLNDFIPALTLNYKINEHNSLKFSYNASISRPGIAYLNPAVQETPTSVSSGNPYLNSARRHRMMIGYTLIYPKITANLSLNAVIGNNEIEGYDYVENNKVYSSYDNIGSTRSGRFSAYAKWSMTNTTTVRLNGNVGYRNNKCSELNLENGRWFFNGVLAVDQKLPWKLNLTVSGYRDDGGVNGLYSYASPLHYATFQLRRAFLKEDRLNVSLDYSSTFTGKYFDMKWYRIQGAYTGLSKERMRQDYNALNLTISYRFGSINSSVKKAAKTISNDDLVGNKK